MGEFATYDPADRPGRQAPEAQPETKLLAEDGTELPTFDPKYVEPFLGLTYIGSLTKKFHWLGHEFVLRTLGPDDQLAVAVVTKPWAGTAAEQLAYMISVVSLATVTVDGEELPTPVAEDKRLAEWAERRFAYVKANWFDPTIARCFQEYLELEDKVRQVVEAMGKASSPAASIPSSSDTSA